GRAAARPSGAWPVVGDRLGRPPGGPGDAALVGQGGRVPRPGVDLPPRGADARHRMAGGDRPRDRAAAHGAVVPERGVAVSTSWYDAMTRRLTSLRTTWRRSVVQRFANVDLAFQHDLAVQRLELWAFGSQLSYRWIREMPNPLLSWYLHGCYLAYYAILYSSPLGLWLSGRRAAARHTIFAVMITFYLCYVVFLFFPVAGPRYAFDLAHNAATDVWPARATQWLLDRGDSWGAAFPSSHVAAAVVAAVCALRYWRRLGLVLAPFTIGLVL